MTLGMGNEASPINFGVRLGQLWVAVFYEIARFLVILIFELVKIENFRWDIVEKGILLSGKR